MERNERLQAAFNHLRMKGILKSQKDLANALGATAPHISCALKGDEKYLTDNLLIRFQSKFTDFNLRWLMEGVGEMLNTPKENSMLTRIKQLVELSRLSTTTLANNIGISPSDFEEMLDGRKEIADDDLMQISKTLRVRLGWLITGQGQMWLLPERIRQQAIIDSHKAQTHNLNEEESKNNYDEIYSKCIRQLEDEREQVRKELEEIKNLKTLLWDAIHAFQDATNGGNHVALMAAED